LLHFEVYLQSKRSKLKSFASDKKDLEESIENVYVNDKPYHKHNSNLLVNQVSLVTEMPPHFSVEKWVHFLLNSLQFWKVTVGKLGVGNVGVLE